jgi:hypothetical protein
VFSLSPARCKRDNDERSTVKALDVVKQNNNFPRKIIGAYRIDLVLLSPRDLAGDWITSEATPIKGS